MLKTNYKLTNVKLIWLIAIFYTAILNIPLMLNLISIFSQQNQVSIGFIISIPIFITACLSFFFIPFSLFGLTKPFFIILGIVSAIVSYSMLNYGIVFDKDMVQNFFETNQIEAMSYFNWNAVLIVTLIGIIPGIILAKIKIKPYNNFIKGILYRLASMLFSLAIVGIILILYYKNYASLIRNHSIVKKQVVPTSYINATYGYLYRTYFKGKEPFIKLDTDAKIDLSQQKKPNLFVLVIGETARAKNYALNGYNKNTNPFTQSLSNLISFKNTSSCGTSTAVSVPCMFSTMDRKHYNEDLAYRSDNLMDFLNKVGLFTYWIDNDYGCKGVCTRIPHEIIDPLQEKNVLCRSTGCFDSVLLEKTKALLAKQHHPKNMLIVLHLIGSHGPAYYQRYPTKFAHFKPQCLNRDLTQCSQNKLINSYDNTIIYTDFIIQQLIDLLKTKKQDYNTGLLYLSDHGESLGENGIYLHGMPYHFAPKEQTHIPMLLWLSPELIKENQLNIQCLKFNALHKDYSQDNLFSSILGIWHISTPFYKPKMDILNVCNNSKQSIEKI